LRIDLAISFFSESIKLLGVIVELFFDAFKGVSHNIFIGHISVKPIKDVQKERAR
jgi:hypothetical protein